MSVNYPELGGVESKKIEYREGDEITHPPGTLGRYKRIDGNWKCVRLPDGSKPE